MKWLYNLTSLENYSLCNVPHIALQKKNKSEWKLKWQNISRLEWNSCPNFMTGSARCVNFLVLHNTFFCYWKCVFWFPSFFPLKNKLTTVLFLPPSLFNSSYFLQHRTMYVELNKSCRGGRKAVRKERQLYNTWGKRKSRFWPLFWMGD